MNRIEDSLTRSQSLRASGWRLGALLSTAGCGLAVGLAILSGCPAEPNNTPDGSTTTEDMLKPGDGGVVKVQMPGCSKDDWCWMFPQPQGNTLRSVWGSSATDAWAVGDSGTLLHYTNNAWKAVVSPSQNPLFAVWGVGANDIYAVGDRATVLHYDGQNWTPMQVAGGGAGNVSLYGVWGTGADDVWIVGAAGTVLHKSGGMLNKLSQTATNQVLMSVWGSGTMTYAVGTGGMLLKYDGTTFTASNIAGAEILTSIVGTGTNNIFVGSLSGSIRRSTDGMTFSQVELCTTVTAPDPPIGCKLFNAFGVNALWASGTDVFAVGDVVYTDSVNKDATHRHGTVKKFDGTRFQEVAGALPVTYYGVWGSSGSSVFMVGASGTIVSYNGSTHTSSSPVDLLTGVSAGMVGVGGSASDLVAAGDWGATLRWNGSSWNSVTNSAYTRFRSVSGSGTNLWSVAFDESMKKPLMFQLSSGAWTAVTQPATVDLLAIWANATDGVAVGLNDTVIARSGTTWSLKAVTPPVGTALRGAWGTDGTHVFIVGGGDYMNAHTGGTYPGKILSFNGATAVEVPSLPTTSTLFGIWGADLTHVFAVGDDGTILATTNGTTWTKQASGTTFPLRGVWGTSATNVYAVGVGGTILHYDGTAWTQMDSGTTSTLLSIFITGKDAYTTGANGSVLHLTLPN